MFSEMDRKIRFSGQNDIFFENSSKRKKNQYSNMLQSQKLSLSKKYAPTKFNFLPRRTLPRI